MTDFEDDPRVGQAFDRLRQDTQAIDAMAPLRAVQTRRRKASRLALGLLGGVTVAILVVIGVSIWGDDDDGEQIAADGGTSTALQDTFWELVEGRGPDGPISIFEDRRVTLEFSTGTVGGRGPCNSYGGDASIQQGSIAISDLAQTEEGCGSDVDSAEASYMAALAAIDTITLEGDGLVLSGGDSELRYRPSKRDAPNPNVLTAEALDGTAWTLIDSWAPNGQPPPVPRVDGWPITLTFDGDRIGGTAACNGYGGMFRLAGPGPLVSELSWTEMGCEPTVAASEAAYLEMLSAVEGGRFEDGQLVLSSELGELFFALEAPVPTADLVGQLWLLDTLIQGEAASSVMGDPATLLLRQDGSFAGGTGCRALSGEYVISGASVQFTSFAAEGDCAADLRSQDDTVIAVLGDGFTVVVDGRRLTLTASGNEGLSYVAVDEAPDFEPNPAVTIEELDGTSWRLVEGTGPDGLIEPGERPITFTFAGTRLEGQAPCNGFAAEVAIEDAAFDVADVSRDLSACADIETEERFLAALQAAVRIELFGTEAGLRDLVLTGPGTDMLFEAGTTSPDDSEVVSDEPLTLDELLDLDHPPNAIVDVAGHLVGRDGSWLLCTGVDTSAGPRCSGRWAVVTNYDRVLDPDTQDDNTELQNAIVAAEADPNDELVAEGEVVYTNAPVVLTVSIHDDGRVAVAGWPTDAEPTDGERLLTSAFVESFATGEVNADDPSLQLSPDGVTLWLGDQLQQRRSLAELSDPSAWIFDIEQFNGWSGPFSALDTLASAAEITTIAGRHNHCAGHPIPVPAELLTARQLSIQPTGIDSCLQWFAVDLFVDADSGNVVAVALDLWEP